MILWKNPFTVLFLENDNEVATTEIKEFICVDTQNWSFAKDLSTANRTSDRSAGMNDTSKQSADDGIDVEFLKAESEDLDSNGNKVLKLHTILSTK